MSRNTLSQAGIQRRALIRNALSVGASAALSGCVHVQTLDPLVETSNGMLRGAARAGVHVFRGVPYGASTAGQNRFLPPQPVVSWRGVREALSFGFSAPQPISESRERAGLADIEPISEDCLFLNVFTPSATYAEGRPVMVWLHGGAWSVGAGTAPAIDGANLARLGGVVVVTLNHRLNVLGYLQLEDADTRFSDSGNVGVLDMIAALRWVRDNIAAFGGDPGNVTIFGQSGGGAKVCALMATPLAKGLFHKAIAQSCSGSLRVATTDAANLAMRNLAEQLGVARLTGAIAQTVPLDRLVAVRGLFRPSLDGRTFTRHPFDPAAPPHSAGIPFMAGNTATETRIQMASSDINSLSNFSLDSAEVQRRLSSFLRVDAQEASRIMEAYRAVDPALSPSDILGAVSTDYSYIRNTRQCATLMAAAGAATYTYIFARRTPVLGGLLKSPHESEVPFIFGNPRAAWMTGGDAPDLDPVAVSMIATWSAFARTGDPNNHTIPHWPRHDPVNRLSMVLNAASEVQKDPGGQARASLEHLPFFEYGMPVSYTRSADHSIVQSR